MVEGTSANTIIPETIAQGVHLSPLASETVHLVEKGIAVTGTGEGVLRRGEVGLDQSGRKENEATQKKEGGEEKDAGEQLAEIAQTEKPAESAGSGKQDEKELKTKPEEKLAGEEKKEQAQETGEEKIRENGPVGGDETGETETKEPTASEDIQEMRRQIGQLIQIVTVMSTKMGQGGNVFNLQGATINASNFGNNVMGDNNRIGNDTQITGDNNVVNSINEGTITQTKGGGLGQTERTRAPISPVEPEEPIDLDEIVAAPTDEVEEVEPEDLKKKEEPAPPDEIVEPEEPTIQPPAEPEEITLAVAAAKTAQGKEIIGEEVALAAKQREQEDRDTWKYKWEKKDFFIVPIAWKLGTRGAKRFWENTIGQAAMHSKRKSQEVDLMAEAGIQYKALPKEFLEELNEGAMWELSHKRNWVQRFGRRTLADTLHTLTWTTLSGESHRTKLLARLRGAMIEIGEKGEGTASLTKDTQAILEDHGELLQSYKNVLIGDYQAGEAMAKRLAEDAGGDLIDTIAGEKKTLLTLTEANDPLRKFLIDQVMQPLLHEGLAHAGAISANNELKMRVRLQNFVTSKEFASWREAKKVTNAAGGEAGLEDIMEASLSFANTIVPEIKRTLLPQLRAAWDHGQGIVDLDTRLNDYLSGKLKINLALGTVHRGIQEEMPETLAERIVSKKIDKDEVFNRYKSLKDDGESYFVTAHAGDANLAIATNRARMIRDLGSRKWGALKGGPSILWVTPLVAGFGLARSGFAAAAGGVVPILGGTAVYAGLRALQERSLFNGELTMHRVEKTLGHTFSEDAHMRKRMEKLMLHQRSLKDYANSMTALSGRFANEQIQPGELKQLLGYLADIEGRDQIQREKKITLFSSSNPATEIFEQENTLMRKAAKEAKSKLQQYLVTYPNSLNQIKTDLGLAANASLDEIIGTQKVVGADKGLSADFKNNILTGLESANISGLGANFVLGEEVKSVQEIESAAGRERWKKVLWASLPSVALAPVSFFASHAALDFVAQKVSGAFSHIDMPDMTAIQDAINRKLDFSAVKNLFTDIGGNHVRLPTGYVIDHGALIRKIPGQPDQIVLPNAADLFDPAKKADLLKEGIDLQSGPDFTQTIIKELTAPVGNPVDKTLNIGGKTIHTFIPQGSDWKADWVSAGRTGTTDYYNLIATKTDGTQFKLIDQASFDEVTGRMTGFGSTTSKLSSSVIQNFQDEFNKPPTPSNPTPDVNWIQKLQALQRTNPKDSIQYGNYKFSLLDQNHLKITDLADKEVAHYPIEFNPATGEMTYRGIQGNAFPEKFAQALQSAGFIAKKEDIYQYVRLIDSQGHVTNIPRVDAATLKQIYDEVGKNGGQVVNFDGANTHPLTEGGWELPVGGGGTWNSGESVYVGFKDWKPFPMEETVEGHKIFNLGHFLRWWQVGHMVDDKHFVNEAGQTFEINATKGFESEAVRAKIIAEAVATHKRLLFDEKNGVVSVAPDQFLDDVAALKAGHGDASRFFAETRLNPLDTKGIVTQFKGNSIYNTYSDPLSVGKTFNDNVFMPNNGGLKGYTHFMWTPKSGDYSSVYSFVNSGPGEAVGIKLGNPMLDGGVPKLPQITWSNILKDQADTTIHTYKLLAEVAGGGHVPDWAGAPWLFARQPLEAPEHPGAPSLSAEAREGALFGARMQSSPQYRPTTGTTRPTGLSADQERLKNQLVAEIVVENSRIKTLGDQDTFELAKKLGREDDIQELVGDLGDDVKRRQIAQELVLINQAEESLTPEEKARPESERQAIIKRKVAELQNLISTPPPSQRVEPTQIAQETIKFNPARSFVDQVRPGFEKDGVVVVEGGQELLANIIEGFLGNPKDVNSVKTTHKSMSGSEAEYEADLGLPFDQSAHVQFSFLYDEDKKDLFFKYPPDLTSENPLVQKKLDEWKKILSDRNFDLTSELKKAFLKMGFKDLETLSVELKDGRVRMEMRKESVQTEESESSKEIPADLEGYIQRGLGIINSGDMATDEKNKRGLYFNAIKYFTNEKNARLLGINLSKGRMRLGEAFPKNISELKEMVYFFASNNWYKGYIELSNILLHNTAQDQYPQELLKDMVLVYAEEWLHALQDRKRGPLAGFADHEVDVAAYMLANGVKLTNDYLLRYDRGKKLGLLSEIDDSNGLRPTFRKGVFVRYAHGGASSDNWQISRFDESTGDVYIKDTRNDFREIKLSLNELIVVHANKKGVYPFATLASFQEVKNKLKDLKNIRGSYGLKDIYTADELIVLIDGVNTEKDLEAIPRSGGLRLKVAELKGFLAAPAGRTMRHVIGN